MTPSGGCAGRALVADMTDGSQRELELPEPVLRDYLGGVARHLPVAPARPAARRPPRARRPVASGVVRADEDVVAGVAPTRRRGSTRPNRPRLPEFAGLG